MSKQVRRPAHVPNTSFLPSGDDTLSYSLEGKSVSNVSWLFDHVISAVYGVGGEYGLTIFKALAAGVIAYLLSLISLRGMPTWWSSIRHIYGVFYELSVCKAYRKITTSSLCSHIVFCL